MSNIKVICPSCTKRDIKCRNVLVVDSANEYFLCPICGERILTKVGADAYKGALKKYLKKSQRFLFYYSMPLSAYDTVAYLVNIDPTNFEARAQHLVSLIELSTVRKSYFNEAREMIAKTEFLNCINRSVAKSFISFCRNIFTCCKEYHKTLYKRLGVWKYLYDTDCAALYYRRTLEIYNFLVSILDLIDTYFKVLRDPHLKTLYKKINDYNKTLDEILNKTIQTIDGATYRFKSIEGNKTIIALVKKGKRDFSSDISLIRTLDKQKGKRKVKDNIFAASNGYLITLKVSRYIAITSLLLVAVDIVIQDINKGSAYSFALGVIGVVILGIFVLSIILLFVVRALIKNKKSI